MYSFSISIVDVKATPNKIIVVQVPDQNVDNIKMLCLIQSLVNNEFKDDGLSLSTDLIFLKPEFSDNFFTFILQSSDGIYTLYVNTYINNAQIQG